MTKLTCILTSLHFARRSLLQLVFFHKDWVFRDGNERATDGDAANFARRSPWPMINILRTEQVRKAQKGIPTGLVYTQNERTLNSIGSSNLKEMLESQSWTSLSDVEVDR